MTLKPDWKKNCKVVLDTRDIEDSSTISGFPVSTHKKKYCTFEKFTQKFFQTKFLFFLFLPYEGVVGGVGGQKHVNIVLGRSHNSSDGLNWTNNQKQFFLFFFILAL